MALHKRGPLKSLKLRFLKGPWLALSFPINHNCTISKACPLGREKKKGKRGKKVGQVKAVDAGLEGFVD